MRTWPSFHHTVVEKNGELLRSQLKTVQINVGKFCNQACQHCHVEAGPKRPERMGSRVAERVCSLLRNTAGLSCVDITGGAPELNEHFREFVECAGTLGLEVIDRCNLTVLFEPAQEDLAAFLSRQEVHIIASLPCYSKSNVEKQRGRGVFDKSIDALRLLNSLGYGVPGSSLKLDLVYNPLGPFLPPDERKLEADYKRELKEQFEISFHRLLTITNMPISRFLHQLHREGQYDHYMALLASHYNPRAAEGVMCRSLISVGWDGSLYDCDFNQMLDVPLGGRRLSVFDIESFNELSQGSIAFGDHCYGCTAGAGSSCGGSLISQP